MQIDNPQIIESLITWKPKKSNFMNQVFECEFNLV